MSQHIYFPIIKTRDSEIRCFENLDKDVFDKVLPIYELTKSRKTSIVPDGDINRRMNQIAEAQKGKEFILDLSTDDKYLNPQLEQLLSHQHGFHDWYTFIVDMYSHLNIVPMIHIYEESDGSMDDVVQFIKNICKVKNHLAFRLPAELRREEIDYYVSRVCFAIPEQCRITVIIDGGHVAHDSTTNYLTQLANSMIPKIAPLERFRPRLCNLIYASGSFPADIKKAGGGDSHGRFPVVELELFERLKKHIPSLKHGDYATVNIEQIEIRGGGFVPRIDVLLPSCKEFFYYRYRRNAGSYQKAADQVLKDALYQNVRSWADDEIVSASHDKPSGISPSFWISVRMNYYIHRLVKFLS